MIEELPGPWRRATSEHKAWQMCLIRKVRGRAEDSTKMNQDPQYVASV